MRRGRGSSEVSVSTDVSRNWFDGALGGFAYLGGLGHALAEDFDLDVAQVGVEGYGHGGAFNMLGRADRLTALAGRRMVILGHVSGMFWLVQQIVGSSFWPFLIERRFESIRPQILDCIVVLSQWAHCTYVL